MQTECSGSCSVVERLADFARLIPKFPDHTEKKSFIRSNPLPLRNEMSRTELIREVMTHRATHRIADLAFYAARDFSCTDWRPFMKAAVERNPVCFQNSRDWSIEHLVETMHGWVNESIYDGTRMAQPDEVWNYRRGDGAEKAIMLASVLSQREPGKPVVIDLTPHTAIVTQGDLTATFASIKGLSGRIEIG